MPNLPISQLPLALSGQPESLMVIVNYDLVSTGETNSIYFLVIRSLCLQSIHNINHYPE